MTTRLVNYPNADMRFDSFRTKKTLKGKDFDLPEGMDGLEVRANVATVTVGVKNTNASAKAAGLSLALQDALLKAMVFNQKVGLGKDNAQTHQDRSLFDIRLQQLKQMEFEVIGYGAATGKGLAASIAGGSAVTDLVFTIWVPFHVESVDESPKLFTLGAEQCTTIEMSLALQGDPLKAIDADLEAVSARVSWAPEFSLSPMGESGTRLSKFGVPPIVREYNVSADASATVTIPSHLPVEAFDKAKPLATTDFETVRVSVGGVTLADEVTPAAIEAQFTTQPDTSVYELAVADKVTPLYRSEDRPLDAHPTGALEVTQVQHATGYSLLATFFPQRTWQEVAEEIKQHARLIAAREKLTSLTIHCVSAPAIRGIQVADRFLGIMGWYATRPGDAAYTRMPGVRYTLGAKDVEVYVPEQLYAAQFSVWYTAMKRGNRGMMLTVVQDLARVCPGGAIGPEGFASGATFVTERLTEMFVDTLRQTDPASLEDYSRVTSS
ncbi:hypothetical protein [Archangium sp.]|uniref:hypothetical protein n=1 Tax=Archangium sp. TaxID=1872627 RepID=UPI00286D4630|nr:hypothetical protein [Archangium sp.]